MHAPAPAAGQGLQTGPPDSDWVAVYEDRGLIRSLQAIFRRTLLARHVSRQVRSVFPEGSRIAELGCGTTESSARVATLKLTAFYVDLSFALLQRSKHTPRRLCADFFALPLRDECLDGVWNIGVMEHFEEPRILEALRGFARVTRSGGTLLFFWPWHWAPYQLFLRSLELILRLLGRPKQWYPDEVSRFRSRRQIDAWLRRSGLRLVSCRLSWSDLFSFAVVVAEKPRSH